MSSTNDEQTPLRFRDTSATPAIRSLGQVASDLMFLVVKQAWSEKSALKVYLITLLLPYFAVFCKVALFYY